MDLTKSSYIMEFGGIARPVRFFMRTGYDEALADEYVAGQSGGLTGIGPPSGTTVIFGGHPNSVYDGAGFDGGTP